MYHCTDAVQGPLPASWSAPGAFAALQLMSLDNNQLTSSIPEWSGFQGLQSLASLSVYNNSLAGPLPEAWYTRCAPRPS